MRTVSKITGIVALLVGVSNCDSGPPPFPDVPIKDRCTTIVELKKIAVKNGGRPDLSHELVEYSYKPTAKESDIILSERLMERSGVVYTLQHYFDARSTNDEKFLAFLKRDVPERKNTGQTGEVFNERAGSWVQCGNGMRFRNGNQGMRLFGKFNWAIVTSQGTRTNKM